MGYIKVTLISVLTSALLILDWTALNGLLRGVHDTIAADYITLATTTPILLLVIYVLCNDRFSR